MINRYCENCGKKLDHTLICSACGTDYNEKPICEHVYDRYMIIPEPIKCETWLHFKCMKCGESLAIPCEPSMVDDLISNRIRFKR